MTSPPHEASADLVLGFTGDVCLGGAVRDAIERHGPDFPFAGVAPALQSVDLLVGNLECCLVDDHCTAAPHRGPTTLPAVLAQGLGRAGFHAMSLANNHVMDAGFEGLRATKDHLSRLGLACFGAGASLEEAERPALLECRGRRLAFIGASDFSKSHARPGRAGTAPMHPRRLATLVRARRDAADLVIVALHADLEFADYPSPWRIHLSRWLIDQGASIVVQHHPHVPQGIEEHNGGLIAYSLGNFVFQVQGNPYLDTRRGTTDGLLLKVHARFREGTPVLAWECLPTLIDSDHRPVLTSGDLQRTQRGRLAYLSSSLRDHSTVRRSWRQRCVAEVLHTVRELGYGLKTRQWRQIHSELRRVITRREERRWLLGLFSLGRG